MKREFSFFDRLSFCLRSKCPVCAKGRLFNPPWRIQEVRELFVPVRNCASCGFHFEREPGYYFGSVFPILPILSLFPAISFAALSYFALDMEADAVAGAAVFGALFGFVVFFRLSIAIYISIDHSISAP
ncbi:MAG: hypothetical protein JWL77_6942 [Chthonomonadaceae bacterium]|nr:hypothetical protein [Chthonomonadaceae bacterium]